MYTEVSRINTLLLEPQVRNLDDLLRVAPGGLLWGSLPPLQRPSLEFLTTED